MTCSKLIIRNNNLKYYSMYYGVKYGIILNTKRKGLKLNKIVYP